MRREHHADKIRGECSGRRTFARGHPYSDDPERGLVEQLGWKNDHGRAMRLLMVR